MSAHPSSPAGGSFDLTRRYVRLVGEKNGFVEFEFAIGSPEVFIEMVLTRPAFEEFCTQNKVEMLELEDGAAANPEEEDSAWSWKMSDASLAKDRD